MSIERFSVFSCVGVNSYLNVFSRAEIPVLSVNVESGLFPGAGGAGDV